MTISAGRGPPAYTDRVEPSCVNDDSVNPARSCATCETLRDQSEAARGIERERGVDQDHEQINEVEVVSSAVGDDGTVVVDDLKAIVDNDGNVLATDEIIAVEGSDGTIVVDEVISVADDDGELIEIEEDVVAE